MTFRIEGKLATVDPFIGRTVVFAVGPGLFDRELVFIEAVVEARSRVGADMTVDVRIVSVRRESDGALIRPDCTGKTFGTAETLVTYV